MSGLNVFGTSVISRREFHKRATEIYETWENDAEMRNSALILLKLESVSRDILPEWLTEDIDLEPSTEEKFLMYHRSIEGSGPLKKIPLIRSARAFLGTGLKEAKQWVEEREYIFQWEKV